jgi:hypothetical protein
MMQEERLAFTYRCKLCGVRVCVGHTTWDEWVEHGRLGGDMFENIFENMFENKGTLRELPAGLSHGMTPHKLVRTASLCFNTATSCVSQATTTPRLNPATHLDVVAAAVEGEALADDGNLAGRHAAWQGRLGVQYPECSTLSRLMTLKAHSCGRPSRLRGTSAASKLCRRPPPRATQSGASGLPKTARQPAWLHGQAASRPHPWACTPGGRTKDRLKYIGL